MELALKLKHKVMRNTTRQMKEAERMAKILAKADKELQKLREKRIQKQTQRRINKLSVHGSGPGGAFIRGMETGVFE